MKLKKELIVEVDARRNTVSVFHEKSVLCGETIDAAMEDPKMEAIFANAEVENYLDSIIRLALGKNRENEEQAAFIKELEHLVKERNGEIQAKDDYIKELERLVLDKNAEIKGLKNEKAFLDNTAKYIAEDNSSLLRAYQESKRRAEELERELKHIATQAGRAVHK